jgi:hypothetical protein
VAQQTEEILKALLPHIRPAQDNSMSCARVDRPEEDSLRISSGNGDQNLPSAQCPGSPQDRQQSQDRFVFKEQYRISRHLL